MRLLLLIVGPFIAGLQSDRQGFAREHVRGLYLSQQTDEHLDQIAEATLATPTNTAITLLEQVSPLQAQAIGARLWIRSTGPCSTSPPRK
jgi:hypothetical protein